MLFLLNILHHTIFSLGLITASGEINWGCPCLGGMATGPCGQEFREAFSCFHHSESEMKGNCSKKVMMYYFSSEATSVDNRFNNDYNDH